MDRARDVWHMRRSGESRRIERMLKAILVLHVAAGSLALASMLIPAVTRKGGRVHVRAGWVFVAAMAVVAVTALVMSGARLLFDPSPEGRDGGFFLMAVSVLTATSVSTGVRVLRFKARTGPHLHWWDVGLPAVLTLFSAGLGAYGVWRGNGLFIAFSVIGLVTGGGALRYWLRPPTTRMHWWFQHMGSMLGGIIAATTAFFVVNAGNLGLWPLAAWLAPAAIGTTAIVIWTNHYRKMFTGSRVLGSSGSGSRGSGGSKGSQEGPIGGNKMVREVVGLIVLAGLLFAPGVLSLLAQNL